MPNCAVLAQRPLHLVKKAGDRALGAPLQNVVERPHHLHSLAVRVGLRRVVLQTIRYPLADLPCAFYGFVVVYKNTS